MDKKSKILIIIFLTLIFISTAVTYYRYMILRDYQIIISEQTETGPDE